MHVHPRRTIIKTSSRTRKRRTKTWRSCGWWHTSRSSEPNTNWRNGRLSFMQHRDCSLWVHNLHDNLGLQQSIGQLGVLQQHGSGLVRIVLDTSLHLLHQLEHLLGRQRGHRLAHHVRGSGRVTGGSKWTFSDGLRHQRLDLHPTLLRTGIVHSERPPSNLHTVQVSHGGQSSFLIFVFAKTISFGFSSFPVIHQLERN